MVHSASQNTRREAEPVVAWFTTGGDVTRSHAYAVEQSVNDPENYPKAMVFADSLDWRPIETAPKAVEFRCLLAHEFSVVTGYWDGEKWVNERSFHPHYGYPATHWMPLPEPPVRLSSLI